MWFLIGEERVTCLWLHRAAKPTISQRKQQLELSNRTWSGPVFWNPGKCVCQPASSEQFFWPFFVVVLYFWVRRYNKTLSDWHCKILRVLLYLPTQIGERRVRCRWSKLANSLGRTKLTNALGKQWLKLSTRTSSSWASWNRGKLVCQSASSKRLLLSFFYFWVEFEQNT